MTAEISDFLERTSVYQLLARLWAEEPGDLLTELSSEPLRSAWLQLGGVIPDHESEELRSALDEDYCRLFVGPKGHLPPIQPVWEGGELDTAVTDLAASAAAMNRAMQQMDERMPGLLSQLEGAVGDDARGIYSGSAYHFQRVNGTWIASSLTNGASPAVVGMGESDGVTWDRGEEPQG